jgi:molybdopterin converting factor small subunit
MEITVKLGEPIWKIVGEKSTKVTLNGAQCLSDIFAELNRRYPAFMAEAQRGEFDLPYTLFVNDKLVAWEKVGQTPVSDGDKVFIFMAVSGG